MAITRLAKKAINVLIKNVTKCTLRSCSFPPLKDSILDLLPSPPWDSKNFKAKTEQAMVELDSKAIKYIRGWERGE